MCGKGDKPIDSTSWQDSKQEKLKHKPTHIIVKLLKTKDKEKNLEKMPFDFYFSSIKVFYISSSL